jgi:hypothetical protein
MLRKLLFRGVLRAAGITVLFWPLLLPEVQGPAYQELPKVSKTLSIQTSISYPKYLIQWVSLEAAPVA